MKGLKQKICSEVFKEKIGYTEYVQLKGVLAEIDAFMNKFDILRNLIDNDVCSLESQLVENPDLIKDFWFRQFQNRSKQLQKQVLALLNGEKQKEKPR